MSVSWLQEIADIRHDNYIYRAILQSLQSRKKADLLPPMPTVKAKESAQSVCLLFSTVTQVPFIYENVKNFAYFTPFWGTVPSPSNCLTCVQSRAVGKLLTCKGGSKSVAGPVDLVPYPPDCFRHSQLRDDTFNTPNNCNYCTLSR